MHLEDVAFYLTTPEIMELMSALILSIGAGQPVGQTSIKYDGTALVFGNRDGFFLSDAGYKNKQPRLYRCEDDIFDQKFDKDRTLKLLIAFNYLSQHRIQPELVYHADWLFDERTLLNDRAFQPNIIRYESRRSLRGSRLGIAVHTQEFCGVNSASAWSSNHPDVYCAQTTLPKDELKDYASLFNFVRGLKSPNEEGWANEKVKVKDQLRSQLNKMVKANDNYSLDQLAYYSAQGLNFLQINLDILVRFKYKLLEHLDTIAKDAGFQMSIGEQPTTHEGYVFRYKDLTVKLVNRYQFSKRNFDPTTSRGWARNEQLSGSNLLQG